MRRLSRDLSTRAPAPKRRRTTPASRWLALGSVAVVGGATLLVPHANAAVVTTTTASYGDAMRTVGQTTNITASFTNANTAPNAAENSALTNITVTPACGATNGGGCTPSGFDPGVFGLSGVTGAGDCATTFTVGTPDATTGAIPLSPVAPISIPPAGVCTITIPATVLKVPTKDFDPVTAGAQTKVAVNATATTATATAPAAAMSAAVLTVPKNATAVTTKAEPATAATGTPVRARATVTGEIPDGAGNLIFELFGPFVGPITVADCNAFNRVFSSAVTPNAAASMLSGAATVNNPGDYYWGTRFSGDTNNDPSGQDCNATNDQKVVITGAAIPPLASPTIAGTATPATVEIGNPVTDSATVTGRVNPVAGATITFRLFGPADPTCTGTPVFAPAPVAQPVGNGPVLSPSFVPNTPGEYRWTASYSGDAANNPAATACGAAGQTVTVTGLAPLSSFSCGGSPATHVIRASAINRTLSTGGGRQVIVVEGAGATVNSGSGADAICGGPGNDNINAGSGNDFIRGGGGADAINAGSGVNDVG
ncbi:MAG: hypothetical protein ACT4P1_17055 [Sporichthyaceae bacterium]